MKTIMIPLSKDGNDLTTHEQIAFATVLGKGNGDEGSPTDMLKIERKDNGTIEIRAMNAAFDCALSLPGYEDDVHYSGVTTITLRRQS